MQLLYNQYTAFFHQYYNCFSILSCFCRCCYSVIILSSLSRHTLHCISDATPECTDSHIHISHPTSHSLTHIYTHPHLHNLFPSHPHTYLHTLTDSPEEGEIRPRKRPRLPHGSPPPEDEWDPCIRMVVTSSECLPAGTLFVVTQDGASVGRWAWLYFPS